MALTGQEFIATIQTRGIPETWQELGWRLSNQAAISTHLVRAAKEVHETKTAEAHEVVYRLFDEAEENLTICRSIIREKVDEYEASNRWSAMDAAVEGADIDGITAALVGSFAVHLYPIVIESVRFNFGYVLEHGFRGFYTMTDAYLAKVADIVYRARAEFGEERRPGGFPSWWLFQMDLVCMEVPMHCDVCRKTAAYGEYSLEAVESAQIGVA